MIGAQLPIKYQAAELVKNPILRAASLWLW